MSSLPPTSYIDPLTNMITQMPPGMTPTPMPHFSSPSTSDPGPPSRGDWKGCVGRFFTVMLSIAVLLGTIYFLQELCWRDGIWRTPSILPHLVVTPKDLLGIQESIFHMEKDTPEIIQEVERSKETDPDPVPSKEIPSHQVSVWSFEKIMTLPQTELSQIPTPDFIELVNRMYMYVHQGDLALGPSIQQKLYQEMVGRFDEARQSPSTTFQEFTSLQALFHQILSHMSLSSVGRLVST